MSSKEYTYRWNPQKDFLEKYRALMERVKHGDHSAYYQVKELRTKEFRNTVDIVNQGGYVTENGTCYSFPDDSDMMSKTVFYEREICLAVQSSYQTVVEVQNIDCLYAGVQLKEQGYNPAVLNMASNRCGSTGRNTVPQDEFVPFPLSVCSLCGDVSYQAFSLPVSP